jgi:hypothetical protein
MFDALLGYSLKSPINKAHAIDLKHTLGVVIGQFAKAATHSCC